MTFRIAVVQPITNPIGEDEKNVADAVSFIARAKAEGADFVCFPESYPGPWRMPASFDPTPRIAEAAAKHSINAVYGTDRKSTRLNSSHANISYAVFCL